ncbi:peptidase M23 [Bacteroidia bacterium]|nr:peptidase M23 [Bacteroidia bacterium]
MLFYIKTFFIFIFLLTGIVKAQNLIHPLIQTEKFLSGSFAELRANHFHAGVDYKTGGKEGTPLVAIEDATVINISVSPTGYGNCIKLRLKNGLIAVYGHLSKYEPTLAKEVLDKQYEMKSFSVNFAPKTKINFKKGEIIGYSGNSGGSGGPHLHFELRNKKGYILNPSNYGYVVPDNIPPTINILAIYPQEIMSCLYGNIDEPMFFNVLNANGRLSLDKDTIFFFGRAAFGIDAFDRANGQTNHLGLYEMQVHIDDLLVFAWRLDSVDNEKAIDINAFIDYDTYINKGKRFQWTKILQGNRLDIYNVAIDSGIFDFLTDGVKKVSVTAADFAGNKSILTFFVKTNSAEGMHIANINYDVDTLINYKENFSYKDDDFAINIDKESLYQNLPFYHCIVDELKGLYSTPIKILSAGIPINKYYKIAIKPISLPENLKNKALVVYIDDKGSISSAGGKYNKGYVNTEVRKFGIFAVGIDTVSPKIIPLNIQKNTIPITQDIIRIKATDDFSGISRYAASIDGEWFLMEYDKKNNLFIGDIKTQKISKGQHKFEFVVSDEKQNKTVYKATINR